MTQDWEDLEPNGLCKNRKAKCSDCIVYDDRLGVCMTVVADISADGKFDDKHGWLPDEVRKKLRDLGGR